MADSSDRIPPITEQIQFGAHDPALFRLPEPPWPYFFEWKRSEQTGQHSWRYWLYLRRLPYPDLADSLV